MLSRERMPSLLILFFMIFFLLESMAAILGNGFIIVVLGREWVRCCTLPPGDMILASLGISRFFLQWVTIFSNFHSYFYQPNRNLYIVTFWNFANVITFWFTTWLAVFYCVKISSFTHPIFLWLKWRISRYVPWLLLWSLLVSTLIFIPSFVNKCDIFHLPVTGNYSEKTALDKTRALQRLSYLSLKIFFLLIPFLFFLASTILLISSLCQHLRNMQHHSAGPQDPSMQVHITTLKSVFFFLILYASSVLSLITTLIAPISVCNSGFWVWEVGTYAGITIHPAFLILNSTKLRRALKKMLYDHETA
ncbi:taste receptor type 2 member 134-like [Petaurus breviceps papuanus]|uniref:taste receptor type 2 member 134-like n=1 Tax=Petaurus breviceps papuanus TaxID=3040969 RepID=UPI0036DC79A7